MSAVLTWPTCLPVLDAGLQGKADACKVAAQFQEKNVLRLHTGTYVQGTEGKGRQ